MISLKRLWPVVLFIFLTVSIPAAAHDGGLDHYRDHLRRSITNKRASPGDKLDRIKEEPIAKVTLPDGTVFPLSEQRIGKSESAGGKEALLHEVERPSLPADFLDSSQKTLKEVLARPEFNPGGLPWYTRLSDFVFNLIFEVIEAILKNRPFRIAAAAVTMTIFAAILFLVGRRAWQNRTDEEMMESDAGGEKPMTHAEIERRSMEAAGARNYREAIRYLYLGFLAQLRERRILSDRFAFTNWEYIEQIKATGNLKLTRQAEDITRIFEIKWYGVRRCDRNDYENFKRMSRL